MAKDIAARISARMSDFSKGKKRIANAILTSYDKVAYMTAAKLGEMCGVSESTVVRFATELGFEGYPEMQNAVRELVRIKLTPNQRIEVSDQRLGNKSILENVLNEDADRIKYTLEHIDEEAFRRAADALNNAKQIYVFGARSSATLAYFLNFNLELILDNVKLIQPSSASEVFEQMLSIHEGDVLFAISFPRYSKKVVDAVKYAHGQKATVIALSDSEASPLAEYADCLLTAQSGMASYVDSLVAPLSLLTALLATVAKERREEIRARFDALERVWDEYDVYDKH